MTQASMLGQNDVKRKWPILRPVQDHKPSISDNGRELCQLHCDLSQKLLFHGEVLDRKIRVLNFFLPLRMVKYAAVTLPCLMYMVNLTYGSPLFAVTGSFIFHFNL
jgi:hypothetical protein